MRLDGHGTWMPFHVVRGALVAHERGAGGEPNSPIRESRGPVRHGVPRTVRALPMGHPDPVDIIELAKVLVAPVAGLVGAWIGVHAGGKREDARLRQASDDAREARLFDHKRIAHDDFIQAMAIANGVVPAPGEAGGSVPATPFAELFRKAVRVRMYGSEAAGTEAMEVFGAYVGAVTGDTGGRNLFEHQERYRAEMRKDLGLPTDVWPVIPPSDFSPQAEPI